MKLILLCLAALLAGCCTPERVLLPQPDGRPSAVIVKRADVDEAQIVLDQPYAQATVRNNGMRLEHMDAYFSAMTDAIGVHQGTLDKYIGDAAMAFWARRRTSRRTPATRCWPRRPCWRGRRCSTTSLPRAAGRRRPSASASTPAR